MFYLGVLETGRMNLTKLIRTAIDWGKWVFASGSWAPYLQVNPHLGSPNWSKIFDFHLHGVKYMVDARMKQPYWPTQSLPAFKSMLASDIFSSPRESYWWARITQYTYYCIIYRYWSERSVSQIHYVSPSEQWPLMFQPQLLPQVLLVRLNIGLPDLPQQGMGGRWGAVVHIHW